MDKFDQKIALLDMQFGAMFASFNSPEVTKQEPIFVVRMKDDTVIDISDDLDESIYLLEGIENHPCHCGCQG